MRTIVALGASDLPLHTSAFRFLVGPTDNLPALVLCADGLAAAVILAADEGTAHMIGRVLAVVTELAFASNRCSRPDVCLDLLLNNNLRWLGSRLLHHHWLHAGLLLVEHAGLDTRLLHHLRLNHSRLDHSWLLGHLDHARLGGLACNTHHDWLGKGLVRRRLGTVVDLHLFLYNLLRINTTESQL